MREATVRLQDGRVLGYAEHGDPGGVAVLAFHGVPGSRRYCVAPAALHDLGVRWLTLERPGIGWSSPQPGRSLLDWPRDVVELADALGIGEFAVLGCSAGGPYAMAAAYALPDRVRAAGLVSAVGPLFDNPGFDDELHDEPRALVRLLRRDWPAGCAAIGAELRVEHEQWMADPEAFLDTFLDGVPPEERGHYEAERDEWRVHLEATYRLEHSFRDDLLVFFGPWGFEPASVSVPVRAWHGGGDPGRGLLAATVERTGGDLVICEGEGHFLDPSHHHEWISWLLAR